jgi:hypothetical protein
VDTVVLVVTAPVVVMAISIIALVAAAPAHIAISVLVSNPVLLEGIRASSNCLLKWCLLEVMFQDRSSAEFPIWAVLRSNVGALAGLQACGAIVP